MCRRRVVYFPRCGHEVAAPSGPMLQRCWADIRMEDEGITQRHRHFDWLRDSCDADTMRAYCRFYKNGYDVPGLY